MDWGMANRIGAADSIRREVHVPPVDHGYFQGPTRNLERPGETIAPSCPTPTRSFATRGVVRSVVDPADTKPLILRVSGGTSMTSGDLADEGITTSMDDAVRLNVSAVGISVFVGSEYQKQSILNLGKLVDEGERYGIPVMAVTAVGRELDQRDSRYLAMACRICAEMGAKVVKTYWCEDGFDRVVDGCPVPVVMAGGPRADTEREVLEFVHDGMQNGAIGINLGRNIWQSPHPVPMIRALRHIVHGNGTVAEAQDIYDAARAESGELVGVPD
ncbi:3-hydroxy-5-phosphonooxypentane-2,4-dione thiolase [Geodia barretti]|uniref:3-hydroxy-5-phosphonooxypentane-2,4-dione thiolase n=1 Tax=Geodia barretti TaxID=519541 RepID=A0AA35W4I4_GEOBA|nr:3-hydroxy-5-phosphonooxypentane-2,4-dione thiolase [Geodia barretti]